jgi:rhamnosyltransferase
MDRPKVCGVLVTYHPTAAMIDNLSLIAEQVDDLVVVDNSSSPSELDSLREASQRLAFSLIANGRNLGIAEALNRGVAAARSNSHSWVLLLDQDSHITDDFVDRMFETWAMHPQRHRVATVRPRYVDPSDGYEADLRRDSDASWYYVMTSGSLVPAWAFDAVGWFDAEYFIDYVDIEYTLRACQLGYLLIESPKAVLLHAPGRPSSRKLLGLIPYRPLNHSALRRYYMTRNRIVTIRRYYQRFPRWALLDLYRMGKEISKVLIGETNRRKQIRAITLGLFDGVFGRMGRCPHRYGVGADDY